MSENEENVRSDMLSMKSLLPVLFFITVGFFSYFVLGGYLTNFDNYSFVVDALGKKEETILGLIASTAAAATAIAAIPGDATTPVANEIANIGSNFALVLSFVLMEKYLLTSIGAFVSKLLIPGACFLKLISYIPLFSERSVESLGSLSRRIFCFAVAIVLVIPASAYVSSQIDKSLASQRNALQEQIDEIDASQDENSEVEEEEAENIVFKQFDKLKNGFENTIDGLSNMEEKASLILRNMFEQLAIEIASSLLIPVAVLLSFLWITNMFFGTNFRLPKTPKIQPFKNDDDEC